MSRLRPDPNRIGVASAVSRSNTALGSSAQGAKPSVRFTDGVTRTLWLLANNVAAFPVVIAGEDNAKALAKLAGTDGSIMRASQAFRAQEKPPQSAQEPLGTKREGVGRERARETSQKAAQGLGKPSRGRGIGMD